MSQVIATRSISQTPKLGHRLIKFRYGPLRNQQGDAGGQQSGGTSSTPTAASKMTKQGSQEAIWDFQIPARLRRAPISEEECAIINNGGPL